MSEFKNLVAAVVSATIVLLAWQHFYEKPRIEEYNRKVQAAKTLPQMQEKSIQANIEKTSFVENRAEALSQSQRVSFGNSKVKGSISLTGARIDDLTLLEYNQTVDKNSGKVELLNPSNHKNAYFAEFGWITSDESIELPNSKTIWKANKTHLSPGEKLVLSWKNPQNIEFSIEYTLDEDYMLVAKQQVLNNSGRQIKLQNYGLISRAASTANTNSSVFHEGSIGVYNKLLKEVSFKDLAKDKKFNYESSESGSWFGFSDKYWLTAIVPDYLRKFSTRSLFIEDQTSQKFQTDYISQEQVIASGAQQSNLNYLFAGAKVLSLLDYYENFFHFHLFDRAIDFGWFYFITKPMFNALKYFYDLVGNFGLSILIVTVIVKLLLYPLARRSMLSMNKMKTLTPEMTRVRELHANDKIKQNQAIMELYKKHGVNPLSGCLPIFIQIPIFFSLYKVIYITLEMRHAPFFGWIKDLSAPDPTTIFNLFGLINWAPPAFLMIGIWPIIMALTMFLQQRLSPPPADPAQAQMMKFLPAIFLFMFANFPAGLVIYWAWSNLISIIQQIMLKRAR